MYPQPNIHFIDLRFKDKMLFYSSNNILLTRQHLDAVSSSYSIEQYNDCHTGSFLMSKHNDFIFDTQNQLNSLYKTDMQNMNYSPQHVSTKVFL